MIPNKYQLELKFNQSQRDWLHSKIILDPESELNQKIVNIKKALNIKVSEAINTYYLNEDFLKKITPWLEAEKSNNVSIMFKHPSLALQTSKWPSYDKLEKLCEDRGWTYIPYGLRILKVPYINNKGETENDISIPINGKLTRPGSSYRGYFGELTKEDFERFGVPSETISIIDSLLSDFLIAELENSHQLDMYSAKVYSSYENFAALKTWGDLYKVNPDWFNMLYENYKDSDLVKEELDEIIKAADAKIGAGEIKNTTVRLYELAKHCNIIK